MRQLSSPIDNYSGFVLVAHPGMLGGFFAKSVVLISTHSKGVGAVGVIINRPLGKTLGQLDGEFVYSALSEVPLYNGGPVAPKRFIFTAWQWDKGRRVFKLHFGITHLRAEEILRDNPDMEIRCFMGHAVWSGGQLEGELEQQAWCLSPLNDKVFSDVKGDSLWKQVLVSVTPELKLLTNAPDDPSVN